MLKWLLNKISGRETDPPSPEEEPEPSAPPLRTPDPSGLEWRNDEQEAWLREAVLPRLTEDVVEALAALAGEEHPTIPPADAAVLYAAVAEFEPTRIMEIGSGASTLVLNKARHDFHLPGELIAADPAPSLDLTPIVDAHVEKGAASLQPTDFEIFQPGEFMVLHLFGGGEDAAPGLRYVAEELLPALPEGVLLGVLGWPEPFDASDSWPAEARHALAVLLDFLRERPPKNVYTSPPAAGVLSAAAPGALPKESQLLLLRLSASASQA